MGEEDLELFCNYCNTVVIVDGANDFERFGLQATSENGAIILLSFHEDRFCHVHLKNSE